jgi:uncharacterized membrane protein
MTFTAIGLCLICQVLIVIGQVLLKKGISGVVRNARYFAAGIACLAVWFFLWLGLMGHWDLSKLYPFEGLNPALMAVAAWMFLKERLSLGAVMGLVLVCAGIAVVAGS